MDRKEKLPFSSGQHWSGAQVTFIGRPPQRLQQECRRGFHWLPAKLKGQPEDKRQAAGVVGLSQAKTTGWTNDKVLQTRELEDVMPEAPDPSYHKVAKLRDKNSTLRWHLRHEPGRGMED